VADDFKLSIRVKPTRFTAISQIKLAKTLKQLEQLPEQLGRIGDVFTRAIKYNLNNRVLRRRSGDLHDSWLWAVEAKNRGWHLIISSDIPYSRIQDLGGVTGKGHRTRIPASLYAQSAIKKAKKRLARLMRDYMLRMFVR
jgi:phage gpG-like protein